MDAPRSGNDLAAIDRRTADRQRSSRHALARPPRDDLVRKSRETDRGEIRETPESTRERESEREREREREGGGGGGGGEGRGGERTDDGLSCTFAFQGYARSRGLLAREQHIRRIVRPPIYRSSEGDEVSGSGGRGAEMAERR